MFKLYILHLSVSFILFISATANADQPSDADALNNVTEGKVVWDITIGKPSKLLVYLKVIEETYDDLVRQNVTPEMVFAFRGPAMKLISSQPSDSELDNEQAHEQVLETLVSLSQRPGVSMESCSVAARLLNIDNQSIMTEIKPVGNTFVSLIGYQHKGYALIPVY